MALRRGFKKEAHNIAREVRSELNLASEDPLNPLELAEHLAIPVLPLSNMGKVAPIASRYFSEVNTSEFSALTVFDGNRRMIVYNDSHAKGRQSNNISHELAHGLLLHPPQPALSQYGCRQWSNDMTLKMKQNGSAVHCLFQRRRLLK